MEGINTTIRQLNRNVEYRVRQAFKSLLGHERVIGIETFGPLFIISLFCFGFGKTIVPYLPTENYSQFKYDPSQNTTMVNLKAAIYLTGFITMIIGLCRMFKLLLIFLNLFLIMPFKTLQTEALVDLSGEIFVLIFIAWIVTIFGDLAGLVLCFGVLGVSFLKIRRGNSIILLIPFIVFLVSVECKANAISFLGYYSFAVDYEEIKVPLYVKYTRNSDTPPTVLEPENNNIEREEQPSLVQTLLPSGHPSSMVYANDPTVYTLLHNFYVLLANIITLTNKKHE